MYFQLKVPCILIAALLLSPTLYYLMYHQFIVQGYFILSKNKNKNLSRVTS